MVANIIQSRVELIKQLSILRQIYLKPVLYINYRTADISNDLHTAILWIKVNKLLQNAKVIRSRVKLKRHGS